MTRKLILLLCLLISVLPFVAVQGEQPVVYGVFFYSPTCPHCHEVMENVLPGMYAEFGDQFQLLHVNVQTPVGESLFRAAYNSPVIPLDSLGVPAMVIGNQVMVGSVDIPQRAPGLVRAGIEQGGIGLPAIPGLTEAYEAGQVQVQGGGTAVQASLGPDTAANLWALAVAGVLLFSLAGVTLVNRRGKQHPRKPAKRPTTSVLPRRAVLGIAAASILAAGTLLVEAGGEPVILFLTAGVIVLLLLIIAGGFRHGGGTGIARLSLPIAAVAGLIVAGYLAYIEVSQVEAVCGLVGDCNSVQQSEYARLFGVLPIAVVGIIGYVLMLGLWLVTQTASEPVRSKGNTALFACALGGVAFSVYLTLVELFVIQTVCMWCLISALIMALVLWLAAMNSAQVTATSGSEAAAPQRRRAAP